MERLNSKIKEVYQDPNYMYNKLKQKLNITNVILDIKPYLWEKWNNPILQTIIRIDEITFPFVKIDTNKYRPMNCKHQIELYSESLDTSFNTLDDFDNVLEKYFSSLCYRAKGFQTNEHYLPML